MASGLLLSVVNLPPEVAFSVSNALDKYINCRLVAPADFRRKPFCENFE
jgi:hypothetical protein